MLQLSLPGGEREREKEEEKEKQKCPFTIPALPWSFYRQLAGRCVLRFPERREHRRTYCSGIGSWRCQGKMVTVGGWQRAIFGLSLLLRASTSTNRDVPLQPLPLLTSFPRSRAGFPCCSVSLGAQLFLNRKRLVHFLVPRLASLSSSGESLSVSDFNLTGWTLEATCWKDSQVTAPSQREEKHNRLQVRASSPSGFGTALMKHELWASSFRGKKPEIEKGFPRKCFSIISLHHQNRCSIIKRLSYVSPALLGLEIHFQGNRSQLLLISVQNMGLNTGPSWKLKFREMVSFFSFSLLPCYWNLCGQITFFLGPLKIKDWTYHLIPFLVKHHMILWLEWPQHSLTTHFPIPRTELRESPFNCNSASPPMTQN